MGEIYKLSNISPPAPFTGGGGEMVPFESGCQYSNCLSRSPPPTLQGTTPTLAGATPTRESHLLQCNMLESVLFSANEGIKFKFITLSNDVHSTDIEGCVWLLFLNNGWRGNQQYHF